MPVLSVEQQEALALRHVMRRFFIWCEALGLDGVTPNPVGFWDDVGTVTLAGRIYNGSGNVIRISPIAAKSDLSIPGLTITLTGIATAAAVLVRGRVAAQRPISVSLGIFDATLQALIPPLIPMFVGVIDDVEIRTPPAGDVSTIVVTCESTSRALTVKQTETRSPASLARRSATDTFYNHTAGQRDQTIYFGRQSVR